MLLKGQASHRVQPIPREVEENTATELREDWEDELETFCAKLEPVNLAADASTAATVREAFHSSSRVEKKDIAMRLASRGFLAKPESYRVEGKVTSKRVYEYAFPSEDDPSTTTTRFVRLRSTGPAL